MRDFVGIPYASLPEVRDPDFTYRLKNMFAQLDEFGRDSSRGFALIQQGFSPIAGGSTPLVDLTNFFYLPGRSGGQVAYGDTNDSGTLTLGSTNNSTKGKIYLGSSQTQAAFDETNTFFGLNTVSPTATIHLLAGAVGATFTLVSDISATFAPGVGLHYETAAGLPTAGPHFTALNSNDGVGTYIGIGPTGAFTEKLGLSGTIVANTTYIITANIFTLGLPPVAASTCAMSVVTSNGDEYRSTVFNSLALGVSTTPTLFTFTVTTSGTPFSTGNTPNAVWPITVSNSGSVYLCTSYISVQVAAPALIRWDNASGTALGRIDSSGHVGIGTDPTGSIKMLSVLSDSTTTLGLVVSGITSQTADMVQFLSGITSATFTTWNLRGVYATGRIKSAVLFTDDNATIASAKLMGFDLTGITAGQTRTLTVPNASGTLALIDLAQTWTALQTFKDTTFLVGAGGDVTKSLVFSLGGATSAKKLTLISSHTLDRSITFPNYSGTIAVPVDEGTSTQILTSSGAGVQPTWAAQVVVDSARTWSTLQKFKDNAFLVGDDGDITKSLVFSLAGALTNTQLTLISSHQAARSITFPDATGTLPLLSLAQTWTAKQTFNEQADTVKILVKGNAAQTAYLQEWQDDTGQTVGAVKNGGTVIFGDPAGSRFEFTGNADAFLWSDGANDGTIDFSAVVGSQAYVLPAAGGDFVLTSGAQTMAFKTLNSTCKIVCNGASAGTTFQAFLATTKQMQFALAGITAGNTRVLAVPDTAGTIVLVGNTASASGVLGTIALTGQTGNLAAQTMLTGNASSAGLYRLSFYLKTTTAGTPAVAQVKVTVSWNDGTGQTVDVTFLNGVTALAVQHDLGTLNAFANGDVVVKSAASQNITFTTTGTYTGAPAYSIDARIESLG